MEGLKPQERKSIQLRIVPMREGGYKIVDIDDSVVAGPFRTRKNAQARLNQISDFIGVSTNPDQEGK